MRLWRLRLECQFRYINDRFLPDKAIDMIDEACIQSTAWKLSFRTGDRSTGNKDKRHLLNQKEETAIKTCRSVYGKENSAGAE